MIVPIMSATEQLNCNTTNIFRGKEDGLPLLELPFKTLMGCKDDIYKAGLAPASNEVIKTAIRQMAQNAGVEKGMTSLPSVSALNEPRLTSTRINARMKARKVNMKDSIRNCSIN